MEEKYQCTYKDGMYYSNDDKPGIIDEMGNQFWLNEYGYHRENKPAVIFQMAINIGIYIM